MMERKSSVVVLLGVILLLVIGGNTLVSATHAPHTVPFKANCQTFPTVVGGGEGYFVLAIPAVCTGSHIGSGEWYADSIVDISNPPPFVQTGDMVFTAANGAKLFGTFAGDAFPDGMGGTTFWGTYEITEGTGRFNGVEGSGEYHGWANGEEGEAFFRGTLTGP